MTVTDATQPELLKHAVLRVAAWPLETVDGFAAVALARQADGLAAAEAETERRREGMVERLHAAVPGAPSRAARAWLLALKRHVFGSLLPLPPPSGAEAGIDAAVLDLIREEDAARRALAAQAAAFEAAYAAEVERQRAVLRAEAGTERFQKALLLSNQEVARHWAAAGTRPLPPNRARRLETTVFHYLMRAAGRPTPRGPWAGVAPVVPSEEPQAEAGLRVRPDAARYVASVNLLPVRMIARALARQPRYRRGGALRLNRTLVAVEGGWCYERPVEGGSRWERIAAHPVYAAVIAYFGGGVQRPAGPLLDSLAPGGGELRARLDSALDVLIDRGLLVSGPELPEAAGDCWQALASFVAALLEPERGAWAAAVARLRTLCERLGAEYGAMSPAELAAAYDAAEAELAALWQAAGLAGTPPGPALYLDMRAPFAATWDGATRERATAAVRAMFDFYAGEGSAELFRRQMLRGFVQAVGPSGTAGLLALLASPPPMAAPEPGVEVEGAALIPWHDTRETVFTQFFDDPAVRAAVAARTAALDGVLEAARDRQTFALPAADGAWPEGVYPGPAGAVLLTPGADGTVWLGLARPQPGLFVTRFAAALGEAAEALLAGLRERAAVAAAAGVQTAEVAPAGGPNPNAALRPAVTAARLSTGEPGGLPLDGLALTLDSAAVRPWLRGSDGSLVAPVYNSGAAPGMEDGCGAALLGLAMGHGWEFPSFGFPASRRERTEWRHLARLLLPGGAVLSPERWTLDGATLARLRGCRDAERYRVWRRVAVDLGLPEMVRVQWGPDRPELLLRTDSPLAVRCLFDTLAPEVGVLTLTETAGDRDTWPVRDAEGQHYLAEVGVVWYADGYWTAAAPEAGDAP